jgi:3-polyprenyl-4-hydroxybenzoate decarboxylase
MRIVVGITGSSGALYAQEFLKRCTADTYLIVSKWGKVLLKDELGISDSELAPFIKRQYSDDDLRRWHQEPIGSMRVLFYRVPHRRSGK